MSKKDNKNKYSGAIEGAKKRNIDNKTDNVSKKFLGKFLKVVLLFVIIIVSMIIYKKVTYKSPEKISIIIGDKKVDLINDATIDEEGNIYVSMDDIKKIYDPNITYDNGSLITTFNKHIAILETGKTTMKVNDTTERIRGTLKEENGLVYLPFSDMGDVYDFEMSYNQQAMALCIDSMSVEKKEAIVLKTSSLKENASFFSKTMQRVKKTEYVTVFDTNTNYTKVRTSAGNIGYIKTNGLDKIVTCWETMNDEKLENINILNEYSVIDSKYELLGNLLTTTIVIPNMYNIVLDEEEQMHIEKLVDLNDEQYIIYKGWADGSNVEICPVVTLSCSMRKICSNYVSRSNVINTLVNNLFSSNSQMVCIDFAEIDDIEEFYRFIIEMSPRFKCNGMKILVKDNDSIDKERIENYVDYIIE